jgi:CheY-like chemotaxis protein
MMIPTRSIKPSQRILIADDDPTVRKFLTSIIKTEGYPVVAVNDGREAYRRLKDDSDFGVVILDLMMPHLRGLDIVRHMRTEKRLMRIPVVVITGDGNLSQMAECLPAGATALLTKPFTPERLKNTLRLLLNMKN